MQSGSLKLIKRILFTEISLKNIYFFIITKLTGLKSCENVLDLTPEEIDIHSFEDFSINQAKLNKFKPTYVLIKNFNYKSEVKPKINSDALLLKSPKVIDITIYKSSVKCKYTDLKISLVFRNYPVVFPISSKEILEEEITILRDYCTNSIEQNEIKMDRKVRTTEEIIEIRPYTRKAHKKNLIKVPVLKTPVYKSMFPESVMKQFKESLAKNNKTRKSNVEIMYIYDKFFLEFFSSIKQDSGSKNLLCSFKEHPSALKAENKSKLYFLIVGQRKDTKDTIRTLSFVDSEILIPKVSENES